MVYNRIVHMLSLGFYDSDQTHTHTHTHTKHTFEQKHPQTYRPMKTRISLCIRAVKSESASSAFKTAKDTKPPNVDIEDSDQTVRMDRPIRVLVGRTLIFMCSFTTIYVNSKIRYLFNNHGPLYMMYNHNYST